jgi:endonuclease/exonuclease/phosphatase family metal-dependent hydrolase
MKAIRLMLYLLVIVVSAFVIFLAFATIDDYRPPFTETLVPDTEPFELGNHTILDLLIWNIGYGGLDSSMDFFYDGGSRMRPSEEGVLRNMGGILETLAPFQQVDFILLQEVDRDSKRSYHHNQYQIIGEHFPQHSTWFGLNYNVSFVPVPLKNPMGKVESGLMTLSAYPPAKVTRHTFPGNYSWPTRLFMLDRCFLVTRHPVSGGKELLVINTHNSAYDDGTLRNLQMSFLKEFLLTEFENGNYMIVGGDWNQTPHAVSPRLPGYQFDTIDFTYIEKDFPAPGWTWAYDTDLPTNRRVDQPFDPISSLTTIIDCFLVSPNIRVEEVQCINTGFAFSDHQPVRLKARLIPGNPPSPAL